MHGYISCLLVSRDTQLSFNDGTCDTWRAGQKKYPFKKIRSLKESNDQEGCSTENEGDGQERDCNK